MNDADPGAREARTYQRSRTVEWGDSDPAALINSPRAFDFAVECIEGFYRDVLGLGFVDLLRDRAMGAPIVHASCDFRASLRESETVALTLSIERLGGSSVTWRIDALRDGTLVFEVRMISSFIDLADGRPVPIPDDFRARMTPYLRPAHAGRTET